MIYLNENIDALDIEASLAAVSQQRRQAALQYKFACDQRQSLAVYLLLCEALEKEYGIAEPPLFSFGPHGKPVLKDHPDIHFNLSHCRRAVLCVVDERPVGCDVEVVDDHLDMDVCKYCFNEREMAYILASPRPPVAFTELWTKKEAFLKMKGLGLTDDLPSLFGTYKVEEVQFQTFHAQNHSFIYTICRESVN